MVSFFINIGNDFAVMFGILAEDFGVDIVVVAMGFFGQLIVFFYQIQSRTADFSGNAAAVKFIIEGINLIIVITILIVIFFHLHLPHKVNYQKILLIANLSKQILISMSFFLRKIRRKTNK